MLYIDSKYLNILGSQLRNFKKKKDYEWNFSCPVCGDSAKNRLKARGYAYRKQDCIVVHCHNCGYSSRFSSFLKRTNQNLYDEYVMERYKESTDKSQISEKDVANLVLQPEIHELRDDILSPLKRLSDLDESHPAVRYVINRKIPKDFWKLLYFAPKFKKYTNTVTPKFEEPIVGEHPRMIIPFFTEHGKCFAFQARAYGDEQPKYFTIKVDETLEKIYGLERVDYSKRILVVEGPIDSLFLPNAIAVSGSSFDTPTIQKLLTNATLVMDNEPRNKEIVRQLEKYIDAGYTVCMFPDNVPYKDINEMILGGMTQSEIVDLINNNTFSGVEAKLKFATWRKI